MTGINTSVMDAKVLTMIHVVVPHQYQQMKQISSVCKILLEVTEGNMWTKLLQRLEFL
jgi:hypothetical protein